MFTTLGDTQPNMYSSQREVAHVDVDHAEDADGEEVSQREEAHIYVDHPQLLHFFCNLAHLFLLL